MDDLSQDHSADGERQADEAPGARGVPPSELFATLEQELKLLAQIALSKERCDHTLQPTALLNELWLRMARDHRLAFESRSAFLAFASSVVRNILVDHARKRLAEKRGGDRQRHELASANQSLDDWAKRIIDLEDELSRLGRLHPRSAKVVELRFFGGLDMPEIATQLHVSERTVRNDWATAKAWLRVRLDGDGAG